MKTHPVSKKTSQKQYLQPAVAVVDREPADQPGIREYPTLAEMGVVRFEQISHYTLQQSSDDKDILRIYYRRTRGSLLPHSRKYRFGRSTRTVRTDSGRDGTQEVQEISPFLLKAISELDGLVTSAREARKNKEQLLQSLDDLQISVDGRIAALKADLERL